MFEKLKFQYTGLKYQEILCQTGMKATDTKQQYSAGHHDFRNN